MSIKQIKVKQRSALARFLAASEGLRIARSAVSREEWNADFGTAFFKTEEELEKILGPKVLNELRYLAEKK